MPFDFLKPKSKQTLHKYPTDFLLGDMLVKAGVISQTQLDEGVKLAGNKHLHVGQMLIMAGYISPRDLQAAVDAQSMLRDRAVDQNMATRCLKIACKTGMSFADVVRDQNQGAAGATTNKLGELLLEAGLIDREQFAKSMQRSLSTGLPLGRILVLNSALPEAVLTHALELQVRVRDGMTSREEAVEALAAAGGTFANMSQEETIRIDTILVAPPRKKGIRLGELMVMAGLLAETDVMNALELGLMQDMRIGEVLVGQGYISTELLDAALELQRKVDEDKMQPAEAAEILSKVRSAGLDVQEAIRQSEQSKPEQPKPTISFEKLLILSRVVTEDDIDTAISQAKSAQVLSRVLHLTGFIDEGTMGAVLQAFTMMTNGFLSQDDTVIALDYCLHKSAETRVTFGEALSELGWNAMLPLQMQGAQSVDITQIRLAAMQAPDQASSGGSLTQAFAESTLGALAELESAAKGNLDEPNNGQAEEYEGQESAASPLDELQMASVDEEPVVAQASDEAEPPVSAATLALFGDLAAAGPTPAEQEITGEQALYSQDEPAEYTIETGSLGDETAEAPYSEPEVEASEPEVLLETLDEAIAAEPQYQQEEETIEPSEPDEDLQIDSETVFELASEPAIELELSEEPFADLEVSSLSASSLVADLEAATGGEPAAVTDLFATEPAAASSEPAAAESLMAELEAANRPDESSAAALVAELEAATTVEAGPEPTIAELLSSSKERLRNSQENLPVFEAPEPTGKGADALNDLFGLGDETAPETAAETASAEAEPTHEEMIQSLGSEPAEESTVQPPGDEQRTISRKGDRSRGFVTSGEWDPLNMDDSVSLRDLFSERLTEPDAHAAPEAEADESAKTAQDLMEELLARAGAEESAKKDEQSKRDAEEKTKREEEQRLAEEEAKKQAARREVEAAERRAAIEAAKREAEELARQEAEDKAKRETEAKSKREAEEAAKREAEEKAKREAEEAAKLETEAAAKREAEAATKREAEAKAKAEAEENAKKEAESAAKREAEETAKRETEEAAKKAEEAAKREAEEEEAKRAAAIKADGAQAKSPSFWAEAASQANIPLEKVADETAAAHAVAAEAAQTVLASAEPADNSKSDKAADAGKPKGKNAELLAAATKAAKAVEQAEPGSQAKEELKVALVTSLSRLAESYYEQGDYAEAQGLYERILMLRQSQLGPRHESLGADLTNLAGVLCIQGKFAQAEPFVKRVVSIIEGSLPLDELKLADSLNTLAGILFQQGKFSECEPLLEKALRLRQSKLGEEHPHVADNLRDYAKLLKKLGRESDAEKMYAQAKSIIAKRPKQPVA